MSRQYFDQFGNAQGVIRHVMETEARYLLHGDRHDPLTLPWMPFQAADFLAIMYDCIPEVQGPLFLDVGAGPGTKMLLMRELFGMDVRGIEIDSVMAAEAAKFGNVLVADALDFHPNLRMWYMDPDIVWLYRPFRDPEHEAALERLIMAEMKPGAILAGGAWEICPAQWGWHTVVDDWELRRGAWMKPAPSAVRAITASLPGDAPGSPT